MKTNIIAGVTAILMGGNMLGATEFTLDAVMQQRISQIDPWMHKALETLRIPGIAVGVVYEGKVVFLKGYGVRSIEDLSPVTENTLFAIGSCSKAFTTCALGQLVDEGVLKWDDPVIKHLPEFRLKDLHATHHLTIRDLVTHRSGLPRHDNAWYSSSFSRWDILPKLAHLEPTYDLREKFQYNNFMYAVAGLVIERVSGKTWEAFVQERIFQPLGMDRSNSDVTQLSGDFAVAHTEKEKQAQVIPFRNINNIGPAGSINSSVKDMAQWVQLQLSQGQPILKEATLKEMHQLQIPVNGSFFEEMLGYGLGWFIGLHEGRYVVTHGGGIDGFISDVALYPKDKIGVVVLTNSDSHHYFPSMATVAIADLLLGKENDPWFAKVEEKEKQMEQLFDTPPEKSTQATTYLHPIEEYVGTYEHPGYGVIAVALQEGALIASHYDLTYAIEPAGFDHCVLEMQSKASKAKLGGMFVSNKAGDIAELHLSFESQLAPVVFKRKASNELLAAEYLQKFVGKYDCSLFSLEIVVKGERLEVSMAGEPSFAMKPEKERRFAIQGVPDCIVEFLLGDDGLASGLSFRQAGQILQLTKQ